MSDPAHRTAHHTDSFQNCRDWRDFLAAIQCAVPYPRMIDALRAGPTWFVDGAARTSSWLREGVARTSDWLLSSTGGDPDPHRF